jgi:hypothetical protein
MYWLRVPPYGHRYDEEPTPDIFGLRPAMRTMGKRLAGSGYSVLVVNPFYRAGKPTATGATPIKEMMAFRKGMSAATDMTDAKAFVAWPRRFTAAGSSTTRAARTVRTSWQRRRRRRS